MFHSLPSYFRSLNDLTPRDTETMAIHLVRLLHGGIPSSPRIIRIDQPRTITWLRLVHGSWLLVATSDTDASSLSLWRLSDILQNGSKAVPVSEGFLPAPVRDGAVDVEAVEGAAMTIRAAVSLYTE